MAAALWLLAIETLRMPEGCDVHCAEFRAESRLPGFALAALCTGLAVAAAATWSRIRKGQPAWKGWLHWPIGAAGGLLVVVGLLLWLFGLPLVALGFLLCLLAAWVADRTKSPPAVASVPR